MNNALKLIHVGRRELALDEHMYRDLLERVTGQRSAKDLKPYQLDDVVKEMKRLGFKVKKKSGQSPASQAHVRSDMSRKIRAIWITMYRQGFVKSGTEQSLAGFVHRMTCKNNHGRGICKVEWLDDNHAYFVLESLKQWHYRLMIDRMQQERDAIPKGDMQGRYAGYDTISKVYAARCYIPKPTTY